MKEEKTKRLRVFGIVQGVGFRPTVSRHAMKYQIKGTVCNKGPYVEIWAQGEETLLEKFCKAVKEEPPQRAVILKMDVEEPKKDIPVFGVFSIIESEKKKGDIFVSPDIAVCEKCKEELYDKQNRRYLHPFINCTCCGPRLTILDAMPYDRERTSMAEFPMCEKCEWEYTHPETRRYDAQPVCCNDCGPQVYLLGQENIRGAEAIRRVRKCIREGGIAAVKGIGGFHLCCDAFNEKAVNLLRKRKNRPVKPFAVMMRNMDVVKEECIFDKKQADILDGYQKPIVLLEKKAGGSLCPSVAPGNPKVGVMLPYAPVQLLLFEYGGEEKMDCLVMTSANTSGAPICRDDKDAAAELLSLCDVILSHDRFIRIRADDTVMDFFREEPYMVRRSRGYAPLPFMLGENWRGEVLAMGGELKNTFCIGKNGLFYPSPYIGDMGDVRTVKALKESIKRMETLLEAKPELVACDLHPGYNTVAAAEETGLPVMKIQHHYAHILSCMAENNWNRTVIGVSFDGTGYGGDGTIWGGELLTADYDGFTRRASIAPFLQAGGDLAAKEGWRVAVSLLKELYGEEQACLLAEKWALCTGQEAKMLCRMVEKKINTVVSTSAGRLFDAVSALLGICRRSTFEGEASAFLEFAAGRYVSSCRKETAEEKRREEKAAEDILKAGEKTIPGASDWDLLIPAEAPREFLLNTRELFLQIAEGKMRGEKAEKLSFYFHRTLAKMITAACVRIREKTEIQTAALSGGVYQNQILLHYTAEDLEKEGFHVLTHHLIPPNDGGICLGQAAAAMRRLQKKPQNKG